MIFSEIKEYSDAVLREELKGAKESYLIAKENFEFEEQKILKEKIGVIRNELQRRRTVNAERPLDEVCV